LKLLIHFIKFALTSGAYNDELGDAVDNFKMRKSHPFLWLAAITWVIDLSIDAIRRSTNWLITFAWQYFIFVMII